MPFWMPPRPGCHLSGVNVPAPFQTFTPFGMINASWQAPVMIGGETSSSNQPQAPNFCYPVGYPYLSFPGPWDPSSWYAQGQQSQLPCTHISPGGYGYASAAPPPSPGCTASLGQPFQRGIIRPLAKLSQKHQQLWEAQSAENVQLWTVIGQLQSEVADYKSRLMKLEAEVSSLRPAVEEPTALVTRTALSGQASKRGRPRKSTAAVDVLPTPDEHYPRARGRKPAALSKFQSSEPRTLVFEKVNLIKVEDRVKACHSPATTQQENDKKISNIITTSSDNVEVNGSHLMMPAFNSQVQQENPRIHISGIELNSSSKKENIGDNADDSGADFSVLSQQPKGIHSKGSSATHIGTTANGRFGWPTINPESCGRNAFNTTSQSFYDNGSVIGQGGKHIPGWSFVDEASAPEQLEEGAVGLAKNDNEEEMGEDASTGGEEIAPTKDETAYTWIVR
ncbi:uncharacterized protein LOC116133723 isoform X1 [Pistacia vera]|uniref:uncharacterized protein LOC116133723 isoform X1 n=1 Tax=Pistacia vera TaxID=55513 RepID=UPI0012635E45|nr:uncharacterized protein LOC116133723 isoform X1 [Pistacia vera]